MGKYNFPRKKKAKKISEELFVEASCTIITLLEGF
jgi:hypothetical protein